MEGSSRMLGVAVVVLLFIFVALFTIVWSEERGGRLTVSFLDVGQGDAIFIDAPTGRQVLIDGGAGSAVLRALPAVMPWWDRSIDVVLATHPDLDHSGGLVNVLSRYRVATFLHSSVAGGDISEALSRAAASTHAQELVAHRGEVIDLGSFDSGPHAYVEILYPDRSVERVESNTGCVVARLIYGKTAFMLPCDAPQAIERYLVSLDGTALHSDVLKAGHHGSKTSSTPLFVGYVDPSFVVYSRGCDNTYGHPNKETIDTFNRFGIPALDTCKDGTITFVSDGNSVSRK